MTFRSLLAQRLTVVTPTPTTDAYGNQVDNWASAARTTYPGTIQQTDTTEVTVDRDTVISDHLAFLPPEASVSAPARIEAAGATYEVVGAPAPVHTPRGVHHYELRLKRVVSV